MKNQAAIASELVCGVLLCISCLHAGTPPGRTISGTITDSLSGEVLIGAQVLLTADTAGSSAAARSVATNKFGFYSMPDVSPGTYRLVVRSLGYAAATRECIVGGEEGNVGLRVDVGLAQQSIPFGEIVVEGTPPSAALTPVSALSVRQETLNGVPSLGGEPDILRTLQLIPGVTAESELSSGLYIRGSSPDQNLTLMDGVEIVNPAHLGGLLSTFDADAISDVQLIKGPFPAEYGGRTSSVLDLTMKNGTRERLSGAAGLSLLSSSLMLEGPISGSTTFMVSGRRMYIDLLLPVFGSTEKTPSYYFYDLNGKVSTALSPADRLSFSAYGGRDVLTRSTANEDANFDIDWGNTAAGVRWSHILGPDIFVNTTLSSSAYSFSTRINTSPSTGNQNYRSSSTVDDLALQEEVQIFSLEDHAVKLGGRLGRNTYKVSALDQIGNETRAFLPSSVQRSWDASAFLQDEWRVTGAFSLNAGARINSMQDGSFTDLEPRLALSCRILDNVTLSAAYAVAHQYLHLVVRNDISFPTDIWVQSGDGILPSSTEQVSAGIQLDFRGELLRVEAYHKSLKNLYEYRDMAEITAGVPTSANFTSGTGEAYGGELFVEKKLGPLTGWVGYTLAWTTRTFPELNNGQTFFPHYDKRHDVTLVVLYRVDEAWDLGATWTYASGETYTLPAGLFFYGLPQERGRYYLDYPDRNGYRLPPFHKLDVSANHSFTWFGLSFRLSMDIYNVYNRQNPFARYIKYEEVGPAFAKYSYPYLKQLTLFPILPSFGLRCTF